MVNAAKRLKGFIIVTVPLRKTARLLARLRVLLPIARRRDPKLRHSEHRETCVSVVNAERTCSRRYA
jgi:hypothetical protein